jgi:hypothetical protein|tara:strand:+ start:2808 stop:3104 length:297 start_codon:yes stop_codon:yes gene_type:complete
LRTKGSGCVTSAFWRWRRFFLASARLRAACATTALFDGRFDFGFGRLDGAFLDTVHSDLLLFNFVLARRAQAKTAYCGPENKDAQTGAALHPAAAKMY